MSSNHVDLFSLFSSAASQRVQYTSSIIGPSCPIIATTSASTNKNEIHLQRMPRSVTQGSKDFFVNFHHQSQQETSMRNNDNGQRLNLVLEKLLDEVIEKLLPDGSRMFQSFISSLVLEMNEDRDLKGSLQHSSKNKLKILHQLLDSKEEILSLVDQALLENKIDHPQVSQQTLLQSCLLSVAQMEVTSSDSSSSSSSLAQLATSIALATTSSTAQKQKQLHFIDLIGFPISSSRVLQPGTLLMSISDDFHHRLISNKLRKSPRVDLVVLIKKFDFINFGDEEDDDDSADERTTSSSSSSDENDEIIVPKSISDIVQVYRQNINLSDTTRSTKEKKDDWLSQLIDFCASFSSNTENTETLQQPSSILLLCQQKLPEAARCINEGTCKQLMVTNQSTSFPMTITLFDGVDDDIMKGFEGLDADHHCIATRVPLRADKNDLPSNCIIRNVNLKEVQLPSSSSSSSSRSIFEVTVKNENTTTRTTSLTQSVVICAPTHTIARSVKKLVNKLVKCCICEHTTNSNNKYFVKGRFSTLLSFSRLCADENGNLNHQRPSTFTKIFGRAAMNTVMGILMSNSSSSTEVRNKNRSKDFLKILSNKESLKQLRFDSEAGEWKCDFDGTSMEELIPEFNWVLRNMMIAAIEFLSLLLKSEVYTS